MSGVRSPTRSSLEKMIHRNNRKPMTRRTLLDANGYNSWPDIDLQEKLIYKIRLIDEKRSRLEDELKAIAKKRKRDEERASRSAARKASRLPAVPTLSIDERKMLETLQAKNEECRQLRQRLLEEKLASAGLLPLPQPPHGTPQDPLSSLPPPPQLPPPLIISSNQPKVRVRSESPLRYLQPTISTSSPHHDLAKPEYFENSLRRPHSSSPLRVRSSNSSNTSNTHVEGIAMRVTQSPASSSRRIPFCPSGNAWGRRPAKRLVLSLSPSKRNGVGVSYPVLQRSSSAPARKTYGTSHNVGVAGAGAGAEAASSTPGKAPNTQSIPPTQSSTPDITAVTPVANAIADKGTKQVAKSRPRPREPVKHNSVFKVSYSYSSAPTYPPASARSETKASSPQQSESTKSKTVTVHHPRQGVNGKKKRIISSKHNHKHKITAKTVSKTKSKASAIAEKNVKEKNNADKEVADNDNGNDYGNGNAGQKTRLTEQKKKKKGTTKKQLTKRNTFTRTTNTDPAPKQHQNQNQNQNQNKIAKNLETAASISSFQKAQSLQMIYGRLRLATSKKSSQLAAKSKKTRVKESEASQSGSDHVGAISTHILLDESGPATSHEAVSNKGKSIAKKK